MEKAIITIRKMTGVDIRQVRRFPVQLGSRQSMGLLPKNLRVLMQDRYYRLLVGERDLQVSAFAGLNFRPVAGSDMNFLVLDVFAADRVGFKRGIADELEAHATALAKENHAAGVLVSSEQLGGTALAFYRERGYVLTGNTWIKEL